MRRLAAATDLSPATVHRIWRDHKLKPHQLRTFKFSRDPRLVETVIAASIGSSGQMGSAGSPDGWGGPRGDNQSEVCASAAGEVVAQPRQFGEVMF